MSWRSLALALAGASLGCGGGDGDRAKPPPVPPAREIGLAFAAGTAFAVGAGATAVQIADLDRDGLADLIVADVGPPESPSSGRIWVLHNRGGRAFDPPVAIAGSKASVALAAGDLDGDGDIDLVSGAPFEEALDVLINDGHGGFAITELEAGLVVQAITLGDPNGDGRPEIAVTGSSDVDFGIARLLRNLGGGAFAPSVPLQGSGCSPATVAFGDINADGRPEILTCSGNAQVIAQFVGTDGSLLGGPLVIPVENAPNLIAAADLNLDGVSDLLVMTFNASSGLLLFGDRQDGLTPFAEPMLSNPPRSIALADFTGDGKPDLIAAHDDGTLDLLLNHGNGLFGTPRSYVAGSNLVGLAVGDLDGDGAVDVAGADAGRFETAPRDGVVVLWSEGNGRLTAPVEYREGRSVTLADVTGDGVPDLVTTPGEGTVVVFRSTGDGSFGAPRGYTTGANEDQPVRAADFDGDGHPDLISANGRSGFAILLNDGVGGFFGEPLLGRFGADISDLAVADFDGDGLADIFAIEESQAAVLLNDGHGGFESSPAFAVEGGVPVMQLGDVDGDGAPDLVTADLQNPRVDLRLGDGRGGFGAAREIDARQVVVAIATGDLNGDGAVDLVVGTLAALIQPSATSVGVLFADGKGGFGAPVMYPGEDFPTAIEIADADGDGFRDVIVAHDSRGTIAVMRNDGRGGLGAPTMFVTGGFPTALATGDLNRDGRADIAVANLTGVVIFVSAKINPGR